MATQRNNKKKQEKSVTVIREGRILSLQFFKNNAGLLLIGIVAILALIGLRYSTQTKMQQIKKLTAELEIAESEKVGYHLSDDARLLVYYLGIRQFFNSFWPSLLS